jgi:hypothetical protein
MLFAFVFYVFDLGIRIGACRVEEEGSKFTARHDRLILKETVTIKVIEEATSILCNVLTHNSGSDACYSKSTYL